MNTIFRPILTACLICAVFAGSAGAQCPVSITPANSVSMCAGAVALQATVGTGYSYQWQFSPFATTYTNIAGATASSYSPTATGYYRVVVNGPSSCTATSGFVSVSIYPSPTAMISPGGPVCPGNSLCANPGVGLTYQWFSNGASITGATNVCYTPSGNGSYQVRVSNSTNCQSLSTAVTVAPTPPVINTVSIVGPACPGGNIQFVTSVSGATMYSWSGPNNFTSSVQSPVLSNATLNMAGLYSLVAANNCGADTFDYNLAITCTDSVYPGDVNYDYVVNANDALDLALANGLTGPARTGANNSWVGQWATNWNGLMPAATPTVNAKHGDCNGDGVISLADTTAISLNYSLVHNKGGASHQQKVTGLPDLYFDMTGIHAYPGADLSIPVMLGTPASPMTGLTGLAANVKVTGVQLAQSPYIQSANGGWMGALANLLSFNKSAGGSNVDYVLARTDHHSASGNGVIGYLRVKVPSATPIGQQLILGFGSVRMVDSSGREITGYNVLSDTVQVVPSAVALASGFSGNAVIVPNPSNGAASVHLQLVQDAQVALAVYDMAGRRVAVAQQPVRSGAADVALPYEGLLPGSYSVSVLCDGVAVKTLRWVKLR